MNSSAMQQLARTALAEQATEHARQLSKAADSDQNWLLEGIVLQQCGDCQHHHYPAQALCPNCLSEKLNWEKRSNQGQLMSFTHLHVSMNSLYQAQTPWSVGSVEQADGATLFAFLQLESPKIGDSVQLFTAPDASGQSVIIAVDNNDSAAQEAQQLAKKLAHAYTELT